MKEKEIWGTDVTTVENVEKGDKAVVYVEISGYGAKLNQFLESLRDINTCPGIKQKKN